MSSGSDADLRQAFERILSQYELPPRRLTFSYAAEQADRDDIHQEILTALWTALPRFRGDSSERTWVYRIAHNIAISLSVRRHRWTRGRETVTPDLPCADSLNPEAESLEEERHRILVEAVRRISGPDKQIVMLHLEGLSKREIADVVGLSEGAVATRLSRVRTTLAESIGKGQVKYERR